MVNFRKLAIESAQIATDKKCEDIVVLNVRRLTTLCDYFVIATVDSNPQMKSVISTLKIELNKKGYHQLFFEQGSIIPSSWQVLDYGGVVIHLMMPSARKFYALERIWYKARSLSIPKKKKISKKK